MIPPTVAALYVDPRGPYPHITGVECWGLPYRNALNYVGPYPVVAHPPCGGWGRLRHLHRKQDVHLAPIAVDQVRRWGGVLEHPARSLLWNAAGLPRPGQPSDHFGGYTIEVSQCDWGHCARKMTWLYCVGVPCNRIVRPPRREPTHWISGGRGRVGKKAKTTPVPPGIKVASAQQRRRTPQLFAEYLVSLARAASTERTVLHG